jgi:hypothetical protein
MMNPSLLSNLQRSKGSEVLSGASDDELRALPAVVRLPADHVEFLRRANGVHVYGGYFRLFGCGPAAAIDMHEWNATDTWKFSWNKPLDEFWFFGETAWGDQYAYRRNNLGEMSQSQIFFLDAIAMQPEIIAEDFSSFFENEFLRNASSPYDANLVAARNRLGDITPSEHIVYAPSPLIAGEELVDSVIKVDAVSAMIINGDLHAQLGDETFDRSVRSLEHYEDSRGRSRIKVRWD